MDNNLNFNTPTQIKHPNTAWAVIITAVVVALLTGTGIYLLQAQKIKTLENQLSALNQTLTLLAAKSVLNTQTTQSNIVTSTTTSTVTTTTAENTTTTETGLKLYTDNNTGMSFQYPSNLYAHAQSDAIREKYILSNLIITTSKETYKPEPQNYFPAKDGDISIVTQKLLGSSGNLLTRDQFIKQYFATSSKALHSNWERDPIYTWVNINGRSYRLAEIGSVNSQTSNFTYYFISNDKVYRFLLVTDKAMSKETVENHKTLQQILSTFNP